MSASTAAPPRVPLETWPILLAAAAAGIYAFGHLGWYLQTPLGQVPVLDQREGLAFANALVSGTLPAEPFYRAPGYGLLLAVLRWSGVSAAGLFSAALFLGACFHALTAALVARTAQVWFGASAAVIAGLLTALNPVLVHFAIQATDTTPALACFAGGLAFLAPEFAGPSTPRRVLRWVASSVCWAAATVLRPNYLLVWLTLPLLAALVAWQSAASGRKLPRDPGANADAAAPRSRRQSAGFVAGALAGVGLFVAIGLWQQRLCGHFGFLPTQGAYNLWAANGPGANGYYFTQKVALSAALAERNPTRAESMILYQRATGLPADDFARVNAYWRRQFLDYVSHHPVAWAGRLACKAYALLNDWEQYNNDTPAFHLARSPWLRWNRLSWGLLLVLAVLGSRRLATEARPTIPLVALVAAAAAGSALLFFVSARFRLPLTLLLTVLAAAALASAHRWWSWPRRTRLALAGAVIGTAALTFSSFGAVRNTATYVQDHALLARASATIGDDAQAWREATAALAIRPDHPDALRLAVASYFNLFINGAAAASAEPQWLDAATRFLATQGNEPDLRAVAAIALWRSGARDHALAEWKALGNAPAAMAARFLAGDRAVTPADLPAQNPSREPLVGLALAVQNPDGPNADPRLRVIAWRLFHSQR